ncbi:hypothetical protein V1477_013601 [Vespula maculifrons]|uniref:Uncharacterized protein n=1 Tax=Vespula maculifrons TaxID=7453 RepID=A0ABD2BRH2_VESMC
MNDEEDDDDDDDDDDDHDDDDDERTQKGKKETEHTRVSLTIALLCPRIINHRYQNNRSVIDLFGIIDELLLIRVSLKKANGIRLIEKKNTGKDAKGTRTRDYDTVGRYKQVGWLLLPGGRARRAAKGVVEGMQPLLEEEGCWMVGPGCIN